MASKITFANFEEHKVKTGESLDGIATQHGITEKQLAQFNWGISEPKQINECLHDLVGCRQKTKNGKNYIFTGKDDPGIIFIPIKSPTYELETGQTHHIQVNRPRLTSNLEVETVDDFLQVVSNMTVVLKRQEGGPDVEITTDDKGYGEANNLLSGHYIVTVKGGGPAYFLVRTNQPNNEDPNAEIGKFEEAIIDTRQRVEALTQVVVVRIATHAEKQERRLLQKVYTRTKNVEVKTNRNKPSIQDSSEYTRLSHTWAIDDLALIAGWKGDSIDIRALVTSVLPSFFKDRDGAPATRHYHVWVIEATAKTPLMTLYNESGSLEGSFKLAQHLYGLFGAYSIYEDRGGQLFVDMMTKSYSIGVEGMEEEVVPLQELVSLDAQSDLVNAANFHAGEVAVMYFLPTLGQLKTIGMHGGSGRLEDYGNQEKVNDSIHRRNIFVCRRVSELYNGYVADYIDRVKKTRNEKELKALRAPWAPYMMPTPAKATYAQIRDIYNAYDVRQFDAWKAICLQLDKFAKRMSEGYPYISLKAKYVFSDKKAESEEALEKLAKGSASLGEPVPVSVEVEGSLTFQFTDNDIRTLTGHEEKAMLSGEGDLKLQGSKYKLGLEYKRNLENPKEWEVTIKTGPLELEANKEGNRKIALEALPEIWAESQFNPNKATFEGGLKIETGAIVEILEKVPVKNKHLNEFFEKYGKKIIPKEISIHAGMVGLKQSTILAVITNAPGFFDRRPLDELVEQQWNALDLDERVHLTQLGWEQCSWDLKSYSDAEVPKTMEEDWDEFTAEQQIATVQLGFNDDDDYHKHIEDFRAKKKKTGWKDAVQRQQCVRKEGKGGEAGASE